MEVDRRSPDFNLRFTSLAVCHRVTTLDRAKLGKRIGVLSPELLTQLEGGLKAALDLD